ncbi:MAG: sigma-54 dependent transcriptional regulator [Betaproteobacteria bacterium]
MNTSTPNVLQAVWLDPFSPLDDEQRAQLGEAGLALHAISTLGDLTLALRRAHVMVIGLGDSADMLREVQTLIGQLGFNVPVICRVERRRMEVAVDAMRHGALHVLPSDEWSVQAWHVATQGMQLNDSTQPKSFVFVDPVSQHLLALAQRVAQTEVTALLVGPTGAGKEVLARVLHESSNRAKGPFVALNCSALPEHLIEDMLFGHEKGAFTGAHKDHKGLFEQAQGGTVFLDEIGEMPIHLQAKLLRVLQEKKLNRLGGESAIDLDVRVIAATNKDLRQAIEAREFREDLYFRISTFRLRIQPLCERPGDILPLAMQALNRLAKDGVPLSLSMESQLMLQQYPWPGNVRELENVVQRAVVLCRGRVVTPAHLMFDDNQPLYIDQNNRPQFQQAVHVMEPTDPSADSFMAPAGSDDMKIAAPEDLMSAVKASEHQVILAAIQATDNRVEAAKKLGISPRTLRYKLAQLRERGMELAVAG